MIWRLRGFRPLAGLEMESFLAEALEHLIRIKRLFFALTLQMCLEVLLAFPNSCQEDEEERENK